MCERICICACMQDFAGILGLLFFESWSFCSKNCQLSMHFLDNSKNKHRKLDFVFVSALCIIHKNRIRTEGGRSSAYPQLGKSQLLAIYVHKLYLRVSLNSADWGFWTLSPKYISVRPIINIWFVQLACGFEMGFGHGIASRDAIIWGYGMGLYMYGYFGVNGFLRTWGTSGLHWLNDFGLRGTYFVLSFFNYNLEFFSAMCFKLY